MQIDVLGKAVDAVKQLVIRNLAQHIGNQADGFGSLVHARTSAFPGIKRHVVVDTMGLPHAIAVTTADVADRDGAILLNLDSLSCVKKFLVDGGYSGEPFPFIIMQFMLMIAILSQRMKNNTLLRLFFLVFNLLF